MPKPKINLRILNESILRRFDQMEGYQSEIGQPHKNSLGYVDSNHSIPLLFLDSDPVPSPEAKRPSEAPLLNSGQDISPTLTHRVSCKDGDIWLAGSALLCSCPDCIAPMTIRVWLGLADCWRCQTSISLTEEQIHAVNRLTQKTKTDTVLHRSPFQSQRRRLSDSHPRQPRTHLNLLPRPTGPKPNLNPLAALLPSPALFATGSLLPPLGSSA